MKTRSVVPKVLALNGAALLAAVPALAVETTGVLGSPGATTTIDGKQLPPPQPKFGGEIKKLARDSKPWWAPRVVPPKGAPNVLLIMTDDAGYGVPSTFGGVIPTPAMAAASCSREYEKDIPERLYAGLENGKYGIDFLKRLDAQLIGLKK